MLVLAWLGMHDLGGIQAVFLILLLAISASIGPIWWSLTLFALQAAGYAAVLATAASIPGFDKPSQWIVVTIGLLICVLYNETVRRQIIASEEVRAAALREREAQRAQHAGRLEQLNEELRDASELKSSFVAMASHELRTPLTAIEGFASTMSYRWNELSDEDKHSFVGVIDEQAQRLGRLVDDLLTISRIESGRLRTRPSDVDVVKLVEHAILQLRLEGIDVRGDAVARAHVDPDHLMQILTNFLSNAEAYGGDPILVSIESIAERDVVRITVVDHGPGVDAAFVPELFDRFSRAPDVARRDGGGGTGLGLSIVDGLVRANAARAWHEPNEPTGARFNVELPAAKDQPASV